MSYTNRLLQLREEADQKQTVVAAALGISRTTLSNYEAGMMPSLENAIKIAQYYDVSLDYIAGLTAERNRDSGGLGASFRTLASLAGDDALTASDVLDVVNAAILYECSHAPCGQQSVRACRTFLARLADSYRAAAADNLPQLMEAANAATTAALEVTKMPANYAAKKTGE